MNQKINSKQYHYRTKHWYRQKKRKRLTAAFTAEERRVLHSFGQIPSPLGTSWKNYVQYRLNVMEQGIAAYTTKQYTRIRLDHYIETNRTVDKVVGKMVHYQSAVVFVGAANWSPSSPIKIKKHVRAPGVRKIVQALKKRGNCYVIFVDEFMTSQHCGRCVKRFPMATRNHRFKICNDCKPIESIRPAPIIVTTLGNRDLRQERADFRVRHPEAVVAAAEEGRRMLTKVKRIHKHWQFGDDGVIAKPIKTVWHRDISAAKLILEKGEY